MMHRFAKCAISPSKFSSLGCFFQRVVVKYLNGVKALGIKCGGFLEYFEMPWRSQTAQWSPQKMLNWLKRP